MGPSAITSVTFSRSVRRLCSLCDHAAFSAYGVYCTEFHEPINNEKIAEECEAWEPND